MNGRAMPRRGFVAAAVVAVSSAAALAAGASAGQARADDAGVPTGYGSASEEEPAVRYGMFIDATKCVDCGACLRACHAQNHLPEKVDFIRFYQENAGMTPRGGTVTVPIQCQHCADAPCVSVCPTGASYIDEGGIVRVNEDRCIGCKYCMAACPYGARVHNPKTGTVDKCRFCASKVANSGELMITCVESCINNVRVFGDLNDPESEVAKAIARYHGKPLAGDVTDVSIYYRR